MKRNLFFALSLVAMLATSCDDALVDDDGGIDGSGDGSVVDTTGQCVTFTPIVGLMESRVNGSTFDNDDKIGISALNEDNDFIEDCCNVQYNYYGGDLSSVDEDEAITDTGVAAKYIATYPYIADLESTTTTFTIASDQSSEAGYEESDLLVANAALSSAIDQTLLFKHRMSGLAITIISSNDDIDIEKVEVTNCQTSAICNLRTEAYIGTGDTETITPYAVQYGYQAIIAPQSVEANTAIVTITDGDGTEHKWKPSSTTTFESGYQYSLEVKVKGTAISFVFDPTGEVDVWVDATTVPGYTEAASYIALEDIDTSNMPSDDIDEWIITGTATQTSDFDGFNAAIATLSDKEISVIFKDLTSFPADAIDGNDNITTITATSVTSIGEGAFDGCTALSSYSFGTLTAISDNSFKGCTALESVSFDSVTSIGANAYEGCTLLSSISFPSVTTIGESAFADCTALSSISLPAATTIGDSAFAGCTQLTSVDLPKLTTIGSAAFSDVTELSISTDSNSTLSSIVADSFGTASGVDLVIGAHHDDCIDNETGLTLTIGGVAVTFQSIVDEEGLTFADEAGYYLSEIGVDNVPTETEWIILDQAISTSTIQNLHHAICKRYETLVDNSSITASSALSADTYKINITFKYATELGDFKNIANVTGSPTYSDAIYSTQVYTYIVKEVSAPLVESITAATFRYWRMTSINFPKLKNISNSNAFGNSGTITTATIATESTLESFVTIGTSQSSIALTTGSTNSVNGNVLTVDGVDFTFKSITVQ